MSKSRQKASLSRQIISDELGMTLLESLVAIAMLVTFTSVVTLVMQFTLRFFSTTESGSQNEFGVSNGLLIDHQQIQIAMDSLVEVLSQPGISLERLKGQERCSIDDPAMGCAACTDNFDESCHSQIAFDSGSDPELVCPQTRPVSQWGLPIPEVYLPPGYRLCLWKTTALESSIVDLLGDRSGASPGIYLLQALPESLNSTSLPTRRLFCRPRPFC